MGKKQVNKERLPLDLLHKEVTETLSQEQEREIRQQVEKKAERQQVALHNVVETPQGRPLRNTVMLQGFEWYLPDDGQHWNRLKDMAEELTQMGVGGVWLPPFCKATGTNDTGYGVYDLWDLGEFDQKGAVRTKYGTREELENAIKALQAKGMQVYADIVLNHKAGADESELFSAIRIDPYNRARQLSEPYDIRGWTRFTFPGRQGKYSDFQWGFQHFTAVDYDDLHHEDGIFRILGENKAFSDKVDSEMGNFDYLMFADVDYRNEEVIGEVLKWGEWVINTLGLDGMRMDALKHVHHTFMNVFIRTMRLRTGKNLYCTGEYWHRDLHALETYLNQVEGQMALFDVALHFHFHEASLRGSHYDMRKLFDGTLVANSPMHAVTFVDNHDSQQGQSLESWVEDSFKELAYALILLRQDGYPCLFWGDYYGITEGPAPRPGMKKQLDPLLRARLEGAYGEQVDYFDHGNCVGWVRLGNPEVPGSGLAVVMSNGEEGFKRMSLGEDKAGSAWRDVTGRMQDPVVLDEHGEGTFHCHGQSVSVYCRDE